MSQFDVFCCVVDLSSSPNDLYLVRKCSKPRGPIRHNVFLLLLLCHLTAQSQPGPSYTGSPMHNKCTPACGQCKGIACQNCLQVDREDFDDAAAADI